MAYLDGELAPERAAAAAAHLEQCAECRELAASLRSLSRQLPRWEVEAIPAMVEQRVLRAAAIQKTAGVRTPTLESPLSSRHPVRWLLWGSAVGAIALLLLAISLPFGLQSRMSVTSPTVNKVDIPVEVGPAPHAPNKPVTGAYQMETPAPTVVPRTSAVPSAATTPMSDQASRVASAGSMGKLRAAQPQAAGGRAAQAPTAQQGPMIIRTASLTLLTKEFDSARAALENLVKVHQGYFGQFNVAAPASQGRSLTATVRVPAGQLDSVLGELRKLGRVEQENQSADDVTRQYVDLAARLANARETEKRLVEILRERTGKVSDVLEVEEQIASTREQIEQMDAERKNLDSQVRYAAVDLHITEEYKQSLDTPAPSLGTRVNNAAVEGFRDAADLVLGLALWLLSTGPTLVVLGLLLGWPAWRLVRWVRRRFFPAAVALSQ
jgi:hypothetical protein